MGKTEKIGKLTEEAVEELVESRRGSKVARWMWRNAFPVICGTIVAGAAGYVTDIAKDYAETKREFVNFQLETDYKFRRTEEALHTLAVENVALRKLLEKQQIDLGVTAFKVEWMHPPQSSKEPTTQPAAGFDLERFAREIEKRLGARAKVDPDDLARILASGKGSLYEQRQMPSMPAAGR